MENISLEVLANVLKTEPGVLAESLKNAEKPEAVLNGIIQKRMDEVRKTGHDDGYGRGKRESLSALEKELAKKHEITEYEGIEGLVNGIIEKHTSHSKLNPDDVRKSEIFLNEMRVKDDLIKQSKADLKKFKEEVEFNHQKTIVNDAALKVITNPENKFRLPENEDVKNTHVNTFLQSLWTGVKYDIKDGKIIGVLDADKGDIIRDADYKPLSAEDFVKSKAQSYFEIMQGDPGRSGTGNTTQAANGGGSTVNYATKEDFLAAYLTETDANKLEAMRAFESKKIQSGEWK